MVSRSLVFGILTEIRWCIMSGCQPWIAFMQTSLTKSVSFINNFFFPLLSFSTVGLLRCAPHALLLQLNFKLNVDVQEIKNQARPRAGLIRDSDVNCVSTGFQCNMVYTTSVAAKHWSFVWTQDLPKSLDIQIQLLLAEMSSLIGLIPESWIFQYV